MKPQPPITAPAAPSAIAPSAGAPSVGAPSAGTPSTGAGPLHPRRGVSLHIVDDSGLLFHAGNRQLYALNTAATALWCLLEDGADPPAMAAGLRERFGFDAETAAQWRDAALAQWQMHGLVEAAASVPATLGPARLLDLHFTLRIHDAALRDHLADLLAPLGDAAAGGDLLTLALDGLTLRCDGRAVDHCRDPAGLVPMVKAALVQLALERSRDLCALHAAAVDRGGRCILLPGESGCGKSTLAAALAGAGMRLLGDDTVVLAPDEAGGVQARPLPFAVCLKTGAWPLLQGRFPQIDALPTHHRADGRLVRYLLPPDPAGRIAPDSRLPVGWIVFPSRAPQVQTRLQPLGRTETLARLTAGCVPLGDGLTEAAVARLARWIAGVDCYALHYDTVDAAIGVLRGLTA
jgi:hypothetical protein